MEFRLTRGIAVGEATVLLPEEECEALEARKPQVPAEVIALAREAQNYEGERLTLEECWAKLYDALDAANPPNQGSGVVKLWVNSNAWGGQRLFFVAHSFNTPGMSTNADPLAAIAEYVAACKPKPPAPDFDAMTPDELSLEEVQALRDWLDERGRRRVRELVNEVGTRWSCDLWARDTYDIRSRRKGTTEPAASSALPEGRRRGGVLNGLPTHHRPRRAALSGAADRLPAVSLPRAALPRGAAHPRPRAGGLLGDGGRRSAQVVRRGE